MPDFNEVLSMKADQAEKPKPKPVGTYLAIVNGLPKQRKVTPKAGGDDMDVLAFSLKAQSALQDVDHEQLAQSEDISKWAAFAHDIFLHTEGGIYGLRMFLTQTLGIDEGEPGNKKTLGEMVAEASGKQLLIKLKHEPFINKNTNEAEIATRIENVAHV